MSQSARWTWAIGSVAATGMLLVLAFLMSLATRGGVFYEQHFVWLFWVNTAVAGLLALVIVFAAVRLALRLRQGKFGEAMRLATTEPDASSASSSTVTVPLPTSASYVMYSAASTIGSASTASRPGSIET